MRLGNKQTSMNLHLLLLSAEFVLYFHIYWLSSLGRHLYKCSVSYTVKPVEAEFVPSVPWVLILGTSWEVQDQAASPKLTSEFANPASNCFSLQSQSLLPGKLYAKQGGRKGPALLDEAANILTFLSVMWFSFQTADQSPAPCFGTWLAISGHRRGAHSASSAETTWFNTVLMAGGRNL